MAEPTLTRQQLRRLICVALRMEFFRRYNGSATLTTSSTSVPACTQLTQENDFWNNSYFMPLTGNAALEVRRVTDFANAGGVLTLEYVLSAAPGTVAFELFSGFSPHEIHDAINRSIRELRKHFYDVAVYESLVLCEDTLVYALSGLTNPRLVMKLWREVASSVHRGTATSGSSNALFDTNSWSGDPGSAQIGKLLSIYAGTGAGQVRTVSATGSDSRLIVSSDWTTQPDSTSKYALWDPDVQREEWVPIIAARFDQLEYPNTLYLTREYPESLGLRVRVQYSSYQSELTTEAGTCHIPDTVLVEQAQAHLFRSIINDTRADRAKNASLADEHQRAANEFLLKDRMDPPAVTLWQESEPDTGWTADLTNPLDWR